MRKHHSRRAGGQKGRFVPRLEKLENRCTPAVNFVVSGSTLVILAPTTPNAPGEVVTINDNGSTGVNNVTGVSGASFFPNTFISDVVLAAGGGNDRITYNLTGPLTSPRNVVIGLGNGNNRFTGTIRRDLMPGVSLNLTVNSGSGNDRILLKQIGSLLPGSTFLFNSNAGAGNNSVQYQTTNLVSVGTGAFLGVVLKSGGGSDVLGTFINAQDNGEIQVSTSAGAGNDNARTDLELLAGSTGNVSQSVLNGGLGDDLLTFLIHNRGSGFSANQQLDGGGGFDIATRTNDVVTQDVAIDHVVA